MYDTNQQFAEVLARCRSLFENKLHDYGASWRLLRPTTVTDQIFIKAARIRTVQESGKAYVDEGILPEFVGIVNYSVIALLQLRLGAAMLVDISPDEALALYDRTLQETFELMQRKNHDYGEAWRSMRVSSYVDLILTKIARIKQMEDNGGKTLVSEGAEGGFMDMLNYAVFGIIQLTQDE